MPEKIPGFGAEPRLYHGNKLRHLRETPFERFYFSNFCVSHNIYSMDFSSSYKMMNNIGNSGIQLPGRQLPIQSDNIAPVICAGRAEYGTDTSLD